MDEYASAGGALKLKGAKNAGVDKKKKKKDKKKSQTEQVGDSTGGSNKFEDLNAAEPKKDLLLDEAIRKDDSVVPCTKTDAERKYEEVRRKRLDERFKREGAKTHKERVEELNKYLSNLSEHHDMPRIGPG